ncbi:hypothetical protein OS493_015134 [Desmophyllum pertusum]|uniref:Uncharacterized protein n=1 Tax=Desmophyllum pertusum TaxID=174260 RepID=A0A9X0D3V1_9CNID|nr:hypothetical protein OS493_015134 [Desmophyllum pertusum]
MFTTELSAAQLSIQRSRARTKTRCSTLKEPRGLFGKCIECRCKQGKIRCSRKVTLASFLYLTHEIKLASENTFTEHCNQAECNVANFMKRNNGVCDACSWNGKQYYDGDHWKENGVNFYCSSSVQKVRPGCYVMNSQVKCTGAIPDIRDLSLISKNDLFLCESGDEIRSLGDRCNIRRDCNDHSDERNCDHYYCAPEAADGFLWRRLQEGWEAIKQCSLINSNWTGTFGSKCARGPFRTIWHHKNTCNCEKKTLVEFFRRKIAEVNETNFMNVSREMAASSQDFTNAKVFHDMFTNLFDNARRLLMPLTQQNADVALQYCEARERNFLLSKALEFLRQAPINTTAFNVGATLNFQPVKDQRTDTSVVSNFREQVRPQFAIAREQLLLQLNTAPLLPADVDRPKPIITITKNNVTIRNGTTSQNTTQLTKNENTVSRHHIMISESACLELQ